MGTIAVFFTCLKPHVNVATVNKIPFPRDVFESLSKLTCRTIYIK
jgi:hypothetical protein